MLSPHPVRGSPPPASGKTAVQARPIPHTLRLTYGSLCWEGEGQTSPSGMLLARPHDCLSLTNYLQSKGQAPWQPLVIFSSTDRQYVLNPHRFHWSWQHWQLYLSVIKVEMAGRLEFLYLKKKLLFIYVHIGAQKGQKVVSGSLQLELEAVVSCLTWLLGTKLSFSGRAASTRPQSHFSRFWICLHS